MCGLTAADRWTSSRRDCRASTTGGRDGAPRAPGSTRTVPDAGAARSPGVLLAGNTPPIVQAAPLIRIVFSWAESLDRWRIG